ncbi:two-component system response regulator DctR [Symbiobacterium terraclitae]|uniref:Transcriptional regulatory protein n=1 Tax=Symbiobacterium terraclitae TaxID=557451 RepID=A0ABS4JRG9_9FIRM|nr:two-component system response regulator DctR [Symbiobacterium terraclitae]
METFRVLVVEDDPMVAEVNRAYVEGAGPFTVVGTARTAAEGLELAAALAPDLVLLDIYLPDMDGLAALREIRRRELPCDVLAVTAARDVQTVQEVLRNGAVDYIIKPFKFERLQATLLAYARMRARLRESADLSQAELDRWRAGLGAAPGARQERSLPKGLTEWTLRQVLLYLVNANRPLSAAEVGNGIGLARVTVRRYLDYLVQEGRLGVELQYAPVGRPVYRYFLR